MQICPQKSAQNRGFPLFVVKDPLYYLDFRVSLFFMFGFELPFNASHFRHKVSDSEGINPRIVV
jgi:hypothetical protein